MPSRRAASIAGRRVASMQETREALLTAALAVFAADGFDAPSLDAICARAGLTRGAFYVHFRDREALMVAVVDRVVATFLDAVIAAGDAPGGLEATVRRFVDTLAAAASLAPAGRGHEPLVAARLLPLHRLLDAASRSDAIRARMIAISHEARNRVAAAATAARAAGALRDDVAPGRVAELLVAAALGMLVGLEVGVPLELPALRDTALGLLAPPGSGGTRRGDSPARGRRRGRTSGRSSRSR